MKGKQGITKKLYLEKALHLFAERGFKAVTVAQIAKEMGLSAPALYKHYKNKQDLFAAIIEHSKTEYEKNMISIDHCFDSSNEDDIKTLVSITEEEQIKRLQALFLCPLHDKLAYDFRKLMKVEQFNMKSLADIYTERYITHNMDLYTEFFKVLMDAGKMKSGDAYTIAVDYISPLIVLQNICDNDPSKEEWALKIIENHVKEFNKNYRL